NSGHTLRPYGLGTVLEHLSRSLFRAEARVGDDERLTPQREAAGKTGCHHRAHGASDSDQAFEAEFPAQFFEIVGVILDCGWYIDPSRSSGPSQAHGDRAEPTIPHGATGVPEGK